MQAPSQSWKSLSNSSSRPTKQKRRLFRSRGESVYRRELAKTGPALCGAQSGITASLSFACTLLHFLTFSLENAVVGLTEHARCTCFRVWPVDAFAEPFNLTVIERLVFPSTCRDRVCVPCRGITQPSPQRGQNRSTFSLGKID